MNRRPEQKAEHWSIPGTNRLSLGSGSQKKSGVWKTTKVYLKAGQEGRCVLQDHICDKLTFRKKHFFLEKL